MQLVATGTKPVTRIELKQESLLVATSFHAILHIGYITGNFKRLKCVSKFQVTNSQIPISKTFNISRDKFAECELEIDSGCINGPLRFL